jgi:hypothetical protein
MTAKARTTEALIANAKPPPVGTPAGAARLRLSLSLI